MKTLRANQNPEHSKHQKPNCYAHLG